MHRSQGVGQLAIDQTHHVAPRKEGAAPFFDRVLPGQLRHEVVGNKVAELPEEREFCPRWLALCFVFHPCLVAGFKPANQPFLTFNH
jgi:hypothetical protein